MRKIAISILTAVSLFAGSYEVDKAHSNVTFKVRHMMISNVSGNFNSFSGNFNYDEKNLKLESLSGVIKVNSIDTANEKRDKHLVAEDMFNEKKFPKITFKMTKLNDDKLEGDLTLKGVTKKVTFDYENGGVIKDPWGNQKVGFSFSGKINRADFGLTYNKVLEAGGVAIGDKVKLTIDIEGTLVK